MKPLKRLDCRLVITEGGCFLAAFQQSIEEAGGEPEKAPKDEDELNQELMELRKSLEEKSKKLAERTEGAAKYDAFNTQEPFFLNLCSNYLMIVN